jgi:hypothetical protein
MKLDILPFCSQFIFSLLKFVIDNAYFHLSQPRLSIYRNGVYYMGIKAFNHLPSYIKELSGDRIQLKNVLKIISY